MRCPQCKAVVPDGATFCDRCDAILDESFLDPDAKTPIPSPPPPPAARRSVAAEIPNPKSQIPNAAPARAANREPPTGELRIPAQEPTSAAAGRAGDLAPQAEDALADLLAFFKTLSPGQKVALGGALFATLFSFFPWAVLPGEGSVSGLDLGSILVVFLAFCFGALLVMNHRGVAFVRNLRYYYNLIQVALAAAMILFCVYRLIHPADLPADSHVLKSSGFDVKIETQFGLWLTTFSTVAAGVGLFLPKERR
ncbi:MAG: hypothetical protein HY897_10270 [Deltaproteobacteria bacterium]|nr:hypothetical protein [Deltaproteobacteria bacterium]